MRENDEITGLFRSRLAGAEMTVREGFWEKLQEDVASPAASRKKAAFLSPKYYRIAAAASVIFVLGGVSAAFWFFSPKEEIKDAFTQVAALTPEGSLNGDVAQESFPSIHQAAPAGLKPGAQQPASGTPVGMTAQSEEESGSVSVRLSITIRQRVQNGGDISTIMLLCRTVILIRKPTGRLIRLLTPFPLFLREKSRMLLL